MKQSYSYTYACLHINTYTVTCTNIYLQTYYQDCPYSYNKLAQVHAKFRVMSNAKQHSVSNALYPAYDITLRRDDDGSGDGDDGGGDGGDGGGDGDAPPRARTTTPPCWPPAGSCSPPAR